ncbi:MAG: DNA polymerase IV [Planctomycetota bacterium]|nr:MAG: DNA polymerase IV [Planctomycetota bacterium]
MRTPHRDTGLPARTRRILHLDVDAFLASVEQARRPALRGKPVIVGGMPDTRNLVMSCSYEARASGVRPGMRASEAQRRCPHAIFTEGDSQAANGKREEIVRLLLSYAPRVEVSSLDDFFVDLTGSTRLLGAACDVAERMRSSILEETRMPVTIGIAANRTVARLAGKLGKPGGVAEILPGHERAFLARMPVAHLPGVGHSIGGKLASFSIHTAGDLALVSREVLFASFGTLGLVLHDRARGIDPEPIEPTHTLDDTGVLVVRVPRSIRRDSTFEPEEGRREQIEAMLSYLVERAAFRLRGHGLATGSIEVRLAYVDTRPSHARKSSPDPSRWLSTRRALPAASDSTEELWLHAHSLLSGLPRRRALVKRVGLTLLALRGSSGWQGRLFSDPEHESGGSEGSPRSHADRHHQLDRAMDALRKRHGFGLVLRGTSLSLKLRYPLGKDGFRLRTPSLNQ